MAQISVHPLAVMTAGNWPFRSSNPEWRPHRGSAAVFDPFPAYPHDLDDVRHATEHVQRCCPPLFEVDLYVADREEMGRSNGYSNVREDGHYEGERWVKESPVGVVVLSGKRVPPHPAMTRYLVSHEYGHQVQWMVALARERPVHDEVLLDEYAQVRGLRADTPHHGSGGHWHRAVAEVFACDWRLVVAGVEPEYWPHPGVPRPDAVGGLAQWWSEALAIVDEYRNHPVVLP